MGREKIEGSVRMEHVDFLSGLKALFKYHDAIGIKDYPNNEDIKSFLRVSSPLPVGEKGNALEKSSTPLPRPSGQRVSFAPKPLVKLTDIAEDVVSCHACELHKQRLYPVAGRGVETARLMIVGDWLAADEAGQLPPDHLFGINQDQMLRRMLLAINLPIGDVFISNVIKCAVPATCQPLASHLESCVSFLRRQIAVLHPEIICTMGMVAARALLDKAQPLSQLRGQFHEYEVEKDMKIPVIATYHPTYLLQNPEMKQATWSDLQLLAKKLGLKPAV